MIGHQVATAFPAVLPLTDFCFLEHRNLLGTGGNSHRVGFPQSERVDRAARRGSA
jgi:hypothetical protein